MMILTQCLESVSYYQNAKGRVIKMWEEFVINIMCLIAGIMIGRGFTLDSFGDRHGSDSRD